MLKRGLCGKSGGGGHQSMHLPPARLCSLWPLQKPEVLRGLLLQLCGRLRLWGELGTADVFLTHPPLGVCV